MTNEEAKQEAIKKAYEDEHANFEILKNDIDENGVYHFSNYNLVISTYQYIAESKGYRPFSLAGIDDNKGWIRIEPDGSNLPTDKSEVVKWINIYSGDHKQFCIDDRIDIGDFTHYKPITPEELPVY